MCRKNSELVNSDCLFCFYFRCAPPNICNGIGKPQDSWSNAKQWIYCKIILSNDFQSESAVFISGADWLFGRTINSLITFHCHLLSWLKSLSKIRRLTQMKSTFIETMWLQDMYIHTHTHTIIYTNTKSAIVGRNWKKSFV